MRITSIILTLILCLCIACQWSSSDDISFNEHIRPILNEKCLRCHGGVRAQGGLSLLFEEEAFQESESGDVAIVRGNHKKSPLYQRLVSENPEERMPYQSPPLSDDQKKLIAEWIDQGAKWETHWAYIKPDKSIEPPTLESKAWANNDIDQFVLDKINQHNLQPSPATDRATLIRRLYLDLVGLAPPIDEVDLFVNDKSDGAYEKLVDKLLSSKHYGEHWASMWLDLARYADSKGYEKDSARSIWKYRDWVINAFNDDLAFDEFTIQQLAGDLLEDPTEDQLIATAFHRNSIANDEGGTDDEEFRVASVIERVGTTYEVWQATTMACVQCHSHPYDPFRHEEFYESMDYFNNSVDRDVYNSQPKLFTYEGKDTTGVKNIINWINNALKPEDKIATTGFLSEQKNILANHLSDIVVEAEEFYKSSPLIELMMPDRDMTWQVQDSSWIYFQQVPLQGIEGIQLQVATAINNPGSIEIYLDSLGGEKIGEVILKKSKHWDNWLWTKPPDKSYFKEYYLDIEPIDGDRDLYYRFKVGDSYYQHLFYLDKITYKKVDRLADNYDKEFNTKLDELIAIPTTSTPIVRENDNRYKRTTHLFDRGSWLSPSKKVERDIPAALASESINVTSRLDFANWLVDENNPLTARVTVNRIWEQIFGIGLVESLEDFGTQSEAPSHPELLDWLAVRFMDEHDWHFKKLIKEIVMSATYQQSSDANKESIEQDPMNKWLARYQRTRLKSEQIRDQALYVSGLLNPEIGGPSIIPTNHTYGGNYIPSWASVPEEDPNRRSIYYFWKRTDPDNNMITFDSPDRSICTSRRIRTNTPLQALNLLNDHTYVKASKAMATNIISKHEELDSQLRYGYRLATNQPISEEKLKHLRELYKTSIDHYTNNKSLLEDSSLDLAAMTVVSNAILNLDEFVVKS